ncbi:anaerobic glycerol-3-phosphate dehydrogenase subunit C [Duncaniella muris]|uniref:Anaerobic glycerol-3-phosphate dehydrogenase subunit C n=2 Tax=Duncaniella muris TaxID=2094150 RepID=A0A2V1IPH4_9BACT|nr:anaerobic glycerol-3-phosphate dehydrogenase subunit GlpC [Duncaniella muris]PWB02942.1 anaerobic glycerol-3-phosphate dehydrogenase subunit C [Duncaniella muris]
MEYQIKNISPNNLEQCIKCTICTVYCPVLAVNPDYPGPKQAGPDGERYRLKNPEFYDAALKYCLNCKRCEVACPSNVKIGDIIQTARIRYDKRQVSLRDRMLASTDFMGKMATSMSFIVNTALRMPLTKSVMDFTLGIDHHRNFPTYSSETFESWMRREAPDQSSFPRRLSYFHGCFVNYNNPALGRDFVKLMNAIGYGVSLLEKERCCGVAKIANKMVDEARRDARLNIGSIRKAVSRGQQVIATSSTCVFTIRDEYPHLLDVDNADVRDSILLATAFLNRLVDEGRVKLVFRKDYRRRITYHTPCHMQKLGWAIHSVSLLRSIPGLTLVPLESSCCGIAGTYGFKKENYAYSQAIGRELFDRIIEAGVDLVATDCETCKMQIEMSTGVKVENPVTILAEALDVEATMKANGVK